MSHSHHNPVLQGIELSRNIDTLQDLLSATDTADPGRQDAVLQPIRTTLAQQLTQLRAEFEALVNLYGGRHAG
jgi:hypothetical protein